MLSMQFHTTLCPFKNVDILILPQYTLVTVYTTCSSLNQCSAVICKLFIVVEGMQLSSVHENVLLNSECVSITEFYFLCK